MVPLTSLAYLLRHGVGHSEVSDSWNRLDDCRVGERENEYGLLTSSFDGKPQATVSSSH